MGEHPATLSPDETERRKSAQMRAEDVAYTVNHALVCTATDFIDPYLGNVIQQRLGNESQLKGAVLAEIAGDFGAVPFTIAMQRFFPAGMAMLSHWMEPLVGTWFHASAERAATRWAKEHGVRPLSVAYHDRVEHMYRYEIDHVSQAVMWTVSSIGINVSMQRFLGNVAPMAHILAGKVGGSALTAAITMGGRSLFPHKAEEWDARLSRQVLLPVMRVVETLLGEPPARPSESPKTQQCSDIQWQGCIQTAPARVRPIY